MTVIRCYSPKRLKYLSFTTIFGLLLCLSASAPATVAPAQDLQRLVAQIEDENFQIPVAQALPVITTAAPSPTPIPTATPTKPPATPKATPKPVAVPEKVVLKNFPAYSQNYNLSCEYAATHVITRYFKRPISEETFMKAIGFNPNPHIGFRGDDYNADFGGTWNYGVYAEPIARVLQARGWKTKLLVNKEISLKQELALGRPVQVWVTSDFVAGWSVPASHQGVPFKLTAGEHSVAVYGYDQKGVYIMDIAYASHTFVNWETFLRVWSHYNYMAMSLWPADWYNGAEVHPGVAHQFYRHWLNDGGQAVIGQPLAEAKTEGGKLVQYFERARLEFDPARPLTQPIRHGLLGRELSQELKLDKEAPFQPVAKPENAANRYFEETGHTLSEKFVSYWEQRGGLNGFGYPISEAYWDKDKLVQYFERARLELHPNNQPPYTLLLGLLGRERLSQFEYANLQ